MWYDKVVKANYVCIYVISVLQWDLKKLIIDYNIT